jgi:outer membrane autotransporter protein
MSNNGSWPPGGGAKRGRCLRGLILASLMSFAASPAAAQSFIITTSTSATRSEEITGGGTTVAVAGPNYLSSPLTALLIGPNSTAVLDGLRRVLGADAVTQVTSAARTTTVGSVRDTTQEVLGPGTQFIGSGPGTINCTSPTFAPSLGCNFTGYQTLVVPFGTININLNTHTHFLTTLGGTTTQVNLSERGIGWLSGDLHPTIQTALLDEGFRFIDLLMGQGRGTGPVPTAAGALAFAPARALPDGVMAADLAAAETVLRTAGYVAWVSGQHARSEVDGSAARFGFDYRANSFAGGIHREDGPWRLGAAFSIGRVNIDQQVTADRAGVDTAHLGLYGAWRGPVTIAAALSYGRHSIDTSRLTALPVVAGASYDAHSWGAGVEVSAPLPVLGGILEPLAGLTYNALRLDGFAETGTGFLDLAGRSRNVDTLRGYVGARAFIDLAFDGLVVTPELRARLVYDFRDDPRAISATFVTDPTQTLFTTTGVSPDRTAGLIGAALNVRMGEHVSAFASYDAELRGGDTGHLFRGGLRIRW